jgi:hypothetical protein
MYGVLSTVNMKLCVFLTLCHVVWWMCAIISKETTAYIKAGITYPLDGREQILLKC